MPPSERTGPKRPRAASTAKAPAKARVKPAGRGDSAAARAHTEAAMATLATIMGNADAPATARVSAANAVLDRAWGKPRQDVEIATTGDPVAAILRARERVHGHRSTTRAGKDSDGAQDKASEN